MSRTTHAAKGLFVGLATVDVSYPVDAIPRRNQKISARTQHISAGGPATNAAVTFAFLGGRAALVTAVASHPLATVIRSDLKEHSVVLHDLAQGSGKIPPVSSILVLRGTAERTVVSANAAVFSPIQAEFNPRWLQGVSMVQVDGHYMPVCLAAARAARERGIPVVLDSGSWKDGMRELLKFVDIAICSDDYRPSGCRDVQDVFEFLEAKGIRQIAITHGAEPIRFVDDVSRGKVSVSKVHTVDTLGAGDIFHGAFSYYASQPGWDFGNALAAAARVAAFSCRYPGTRSWMSVAAKKPMLKRFEGAQL